METHKLAIFRGRLKFKSNEQKIWAVFGLLSVVTIIEVAFGIVKPDALLTPLMDPFSSESLPSWLAWLLNFILAPLIYMKLLNFIFIILTIVKAYYITWDFMHVRDERRNFKIAIVVPLLILIPYLTLILLLEGGYLFDMFKENFVTWNF